VSILVNTKPIPVPGMAVTPEKGLASSVAFALDL